MPIHPLAVVDPQAEIHPEATVGPFCVVRGKVVLEKGVELRNHATVYGRAVVGEGTVIWPGAVVGSDPQDLKFHGEDSETIVGRRCNIHECATVSKGTQGGGMKTVIGDDCLIMAYAHIAHDCLLAERVVIGNSSQLAGHVVIGRKAIISGMSGTHHFVSIGELAMVGGMSGARTDVPPYAMVDGVPAEVRALNVVGMRRDGFTEEQTRAVKDLYRELFFDKSGRPKAQVVEEGMEELTAAGKTDDRHPEWRLLTWMRDYLAKNIKGRMQESTREPPR